MPERTPVMRMSGGGGARVSAERERAAPGDAREVAARGLDVQVCHSWDELQGHAAAWNRLLERAPATTIFMTPEWLAAWWKAFARDRPLTALRFVDAAGGLVGLAPMYRDTIRGPWGLCLDRLRLVGDGSHDSDNLDFVVQPGHEAACARAFLSWFERESGGDVGELNTLPSDSPTVRGLLHALAERGWTRAVQRRPRLWVALPPTWDDYSNRLSAKERGKLRYYTNRLERTRRLRIRKCTDPARLPEDLAVLFELHQKRWTERGEPGTFRVPARRQFYADIARAFLERQWLEFWLLELDGRPAAAQFAFRYGETAHVLQEGFDPQYARDSVGFVLRGHVLRQLIAEGVRQYDFLAGTDPSKQRWSTETASYTDVHFAPALSRGSLYLRTVRAGESAKAWMRRYLPPAHLAAARAACGWLRGHEAGAR